MEPFSLIVSALATLAVAYMLWHMFWIVVGEWAKRTLEELEQEEQIKNDSDEFDLLEVRVEKNGSQFYFYEYYSGKFVVQGETYEEVMNNLHSIVKGSTNMMIVAGEAEVIEELTAT